MRHENPLFTQRIGRLLRGPTVLGQRGKDLIYRADETVVRQI